MAKQVKIWFDAEGDFLEVLFSEDPGFMRETDDDAVMQRVNEQGQVLGFSIMQVSRLAKENGPISTMLPTVGHDIEIGTDPAFPPG